MQISSASNKSLNVSARGGVVVIYRKCFNAGGFVECREWGCVCHEMILCSPGIVLGIYTRRIVQHRESFRAAPKSFYVCPGMVLCSPEIILCIP